MRVDNRLAEQLRPTRITPNYLVHAEGSVLIEAGKTKVICTASVEDRVPPFRRNSGKGWVTAEYGMLPRATTTRSQRESTAGRVGGRTQEIQRLIGRSVRAMVDDFRFGEFTIRVDCDVLQADGGTRTAAVTGSCVAVHDAFSWLVAQGHIPASPVRRRVAAVSVGVVDGVLWLDLNYDLDVRAEVDMNVVMSSEGRFVEVQGTGEHGTFDRRELDQLLDLAVRGIRQLDTAQQRVLAG